MSKILFVDDDHEYLLLLGEALSLRCHEFDLATSVEQARGFINDTRYDMIFSDLNMPLESGFDLFRYASFRHPEVPFVLMSGCEDEIIRREAVRMGISAFVLKPVYVNELMETIENLLLFAPKAAEITASTISSQTGLN